MTTRSLTGRFGRRESHVSYEATEVVRVPPFHHLFPMPRDFGPKHPFWELHKAASRAYRDRHGEYRRLARALGASDLVALIKEDVISNVLAIHKRRIGPFSVPAFLFLDSKTLRAWRPSHVKAAQALVAKFQKHYGRRGVVV